MDRTLKMSPDPDPLQILCRLEYILRSSSLKAFSGTQQQLVVLPVVQDLFPSSLSVLQDYCCHGFVYCQGEQKILPLRCQVTVSFTLESGARLPHF